MKALETSYAGCRFQSRLEARWAVFFDALDVKWDYEPEGYELKTGWYLPDFWLPELDAWYEVKGISPTVSEQNLGFELAVATGKEVFIAHGGIPDHQKVMSDYIMSFRGGDGMVDIDYLWCVCKCGKVGVQYTGFGDRICRHPDNPVGRYFSFSDPRIRKASTAARSERFGT